MTLPEARMLAVVDTLLDVFERKELSNMERQLLNELVASCCTVVEENRRDGMFAIAN